MSRDLVNKTSISNFINKTPETQKAFIAEVKISDLKKNVLLLKKFIAMKVLMEARRATQDHSLFNLTAQFRDFLAFFSTEYHFSVDQMTGDHRLKGDELRVLGEEGSRKDFVVDGYRFFHTSDMGTLFKNRKFFNLGVDRNNNVITKIVNTRGCSAKTEALPLVTWDNLHEKNNLIALFKEINAETKYTNSFGYDLFCAASLCASHLLTLDIACHWKPLYIPLALALNLAIYSLILAPALAMVSLEYFIIRPIKWVVDACSNEHGAFIEEVTSSTFSV